MCKAEDCENIAEGNRSYCPKHRGGVVNRPKCKNPDCETEVGREGSYCPKHFGGKGNPEKTYRGKPIVTNTIIPKKISRLVKNINNKTLLDIENELLEKYGSKEEIYKHLLIPENNLTITHPDDFNAQWVYTENHILGPEHFTKGQNFKPPIKCKYCGNMLNARISDITNKNKKPQCPSCTSYGHNNNEPSIGYLLANEDLFKKGESKDCLRPKHFEVKEVKPIIFTSLNQGYSIHDAEQTFLKNDISEESKEKVRAYAKKLFAEKKGSNEAFSIEDYSLEYLLEKSVINEYNSYKKYFDINNIHKELKIYVFKNHIQELKQAFKVDNESTVIQPEIFIKNVIKKHGFLLPEIIVINNEEEKTKAYNDINKRYLEAKKLLEK
jgi:hypothetical protein